eukprot:g5294.t1
MAGMQFFPLFALAAGVGCAAAISWVRRHRHSRLIGVRTTKGKRRGGSGSGSGADVLTIREANPDDAALLLPWVRRVNAERNPYLIMEPGEFKMTESMERQFLRACAASRNEVYLLGFVGNDLAAVCQLSSSDRAKLRHRGKFGLTVLKEYRGIGVGGAMLDHLINWCEGNELITKLELEVHASNERALRLYTSRGFADEGRIQRAVRIDGRHYFDHIIMGMNVAKLK